MGTFCFLLLFKVLSLTGELQSFKMECQDVDTKFKDIVSQICNPFLACL